MITAANAVMLATIRARLFSQVVMQVWCYRLINFVGPLTEQDAQADLGSFITTSLSSPLDGWLAMATSDLAISDVLTQVVSPTRAAYSAVASIAVGLAAGTCLSANYALAATKRSTLAGRRGHGTVHYAGIPSSFVTAGSVTTAATTAFIPVPAATLTQFNDRATNVWQPCIYNKDTPVGSPEIVSLLLESQARTERRRTVGLGI